MPILDVIIIVILSGFVFYGFFFGLIRTLGNFLGMIIGAIIASRFYLIVFDWVGPVFIGRDNLGKVLIFIILFILINRLVGFAFYLVDKVFRIIAIIPFLKTF
ncbi:MAG: CvpA family protein, partial [Patescibacteria group bacterium]|nr:CvpA family protein [Patescibacteria group bacterium]